MCVKCEELLARISIDLEDSKPILSKVKRIGIDCAPLTPRPDRVSGGTE